MEYMMCKENKNRRAVTPSGLVMYGSIPECCGYDLVGRLF